MYSRRLSLLAPFVRIALAASVVACGGSAEPRPRSAEDVTQPTVQATPLAQGSLNPESEIASSPDIEQLYQGLRARYGAVSACSDVPAAISLILTLRADGSLQQVVPDSVAAPFLACIEEALAGLSVDAFAQSEYQLPVLMRLGTPMPQIPSRNEVGLAFFAISPDVARCGDGSGASLSVRITLGGNGLVSRVRVPPQHAVFESCVVGLVQRAQVPMFERREFSVNFPYRLQ